MNILTMGVSGCGKSTIGQKIASHFGIPYLEGDDFHPQANLDKMAAGNSLTDVDREPWLKALSEVLAQAETTNGSVLGCSALKESYRATLRNSLKGELLIVWLDGSKEVLLSRLQARADHFFPPHLLDSQLDTLEPPHQAIRIDIDQAIEAIVDQCLAGLSNR